MTKAEEQKEDSKNGALSHLSLMDKAWDFQWVLRFSCIVLFIDAALVLKGSKGLLHWSASTDRLWQDLGFLVVAAATFGILASLVLPTLAYVLRWLVVRIPFPEASDFGQWRRGEVPAEGLRELALERQSEFLLRLYDRSQHDRKKRRVDLQQAGDLVFATMVLAITDGVLALLHADGSSLVHDALRPLGDWSWVLVTLLLVCAGSFLNVTWFRTERPHGIFYPPLARELQERERKLRNER